MKRLTDSLRRIGTQRASTRSMRSATATSTQHGFGLMRRQNEKLHGLGARSLSTSTTCSRRQASNSQLQVLRTTGGSSSTIPSCMLGWRRLSGKAGSSQSVALGLSSMATCPTLSPWHASSSTDSGSSLKSSERRLRFSFYQTRSGTVASCLRLPRTQASTASWR